MKKYYNSYKELLHTINNMQKHKYESGKSGLIKYLKIFLLTTENYKDSRSNLWATTLSFYSIFSIVPIVAILFSIAKGFGFENNFKNLVVGSFPLDKNVGVYIFEYAQNILNSAKGGLIALVGIVSLIWAVIKIFSLIEASFNEIWKVKNSRNVFRKFTDYITIVVLFPTVIIASNILSAYIGVQLDNLSDSKVGFITKFGLIILRYSPVLSMTLALTMLYLVIPNTKVNFNSAFLSAITTSVLLQITQILFFTFQSNLLESNKIYGSFAIIPIFFLWQRMIWILILIGAQMSFIYQNSYKYDYSLNNLKLSNNETLKISTISMCLFMNNFENGKKPLSITELSKSLSLSINLTQNIVRLLTDINLLIEVHSDDDQLRFNPAVDPEIITIKYIKDSLDNNGVKNLLNFEENQENKTLYENILKSINESNLTIKIKNIIKEEL